MTRDIHPVFMIFKIKNAQKQALLHTKHQNKGDF